MLGSVLIDLWTKQMPVLQKLIPYDPSRTDLDPESYHSILEDYSTPPATQKELITYHQYFTQQLLSTHPNRLSNGDFQTQYRLAWQIIEQVDKLGLLPLKKQLTILDPTCGTGVFLLATMSYINSKYPDCTLQIVGIERNTDSLQLAHIFLVIGNQILNRNDQLLLIASDLHDAIEQQELPKTDLLIGNPPWVNWSNLTDKDRERWKLVETTTDYQFIRGHGMQRAMGTTNVDIGVLLILRALYQLAYDHTIFVFLFKPAVLNSPSLYWFRQGRIPHKHARYLQLRYILQFNRADQFIGHTTMATDCYIGNMQPTAAFQPIIQYQTKAEKQVLTPMHLGDEILYLPENVVLPLDHTKQVEIRHGLKHDCRDVFEITVEQAEKLDWQCVYPTIKSRHMQEQGWTGDYDLVIIPQQSLQPMDEQDFQTTYPKVYRYLTNHKTQLQARKSRWVKQKTFYGIFGIGPYSFTNYKVAWVRLGWKPYFDVIPPVRLPNGEIKPVVPSDHYMFIPTEDKAYATKISELLNSPKYQEAIDKLSSKKKSSLPKKLISRLAIPPPPS